LVRYYLVMVTLMWNGVEAYNMYCMLVLVYHNHINNFIFLSICIAWGLPALLVLIILSVDGTAFDGAYEKCTFRQVVT
ncbi:hypothetical protein HELRODRAFT_85371, partial [Helobdella robusta]|uniref:G-protein coupled receptors family 2 profile 2 domain-containing protein n=1 Tax=Helobdella robusta TaxID=6412 RepID=T1G5V8_HELRO